MRKTLIALAVLGLSAGVAHAQSNVTIYGVVDTGYIKETGRDLRMGSNIDNRIGFRGSEDLGGGLKATFELERRFDLNDGTLGNNGAPRYRAPGAGSAVDWDGAANLGLAGDWGRVRFGRVNQLSTETVRKFDPFNQFGVGAMVWSTQRYARVSNTARYDSPSWSGFSFGLSYSLGANTKNVPFGNDGSDNDGWGINLSYDNGPVALTGNFDRPADSDSSRVWNLAGAVKFGEAKVSLLYENTRDKGFRTTLDGNTTTNVVANKMQTWLLGLEWGIGPGELDASIQYFRFKDIATAPTNESYSNWKYALGYTYNLSKRTSAYAQAAYTRYDKDNDNLVGKFYHYLDRRSVTAFQIGMTHKF